jgi:integrase
MIDNYIKPIIGGFSVSSLTTMDVQKMYTKIKQKGRLRKHPEFGHSLSDSFVRGIHMLLHQAMDAAVRERLTAKNPTEGCRIPKQNYKEKRILADAELDIFIKAITDDPLWYDFYYTEISTGLRRGEICALRWEDLNEKNGTLKIRRSVSARRKGELKIGETKTEKGTRTIVLPDSTLEMLVLLQKVYSVL